MKYLLDLLHYKNIDKWFYLLVFREFLSVSYVVLFTFTLETSNFIYIYLYLFYICIFIFKR